MAVATARRHRADRAAKDRILETLAQSKANVATDMSFELPAQPPGADESLSLASPNRSDKFKSPQVATESTLKKRKASKGKIPSDLRRSASTPHIRGIALGDPGTLSPTTDKRRNKLGYHRTSVACGHCRRRKIRCLLPTPEDPQGRCTNCIRLKKECNFYPVDQAGPNEPRSANTNKKELPSGAPSNSSQSSPRVSAPSLQGSTSDAQGHLQSPQPDPENIQSHEVSAYRVPAENGMHYQPAPYAFANPTSNSWNPDAIPNNHPQDRPQPEPASPFWGVSNPPVSSTYPGDPALAFGHIDSTSYGNPSFGYQQGNQPWVANRSMSFGNIEGMINQYPYQQNHPQYNQQQQQQPQSGYSFPIQAPVTNLTFSSAESNGATISDPNADQHLLQQKAWDYNQVPQQLTNASTPNQPVLGSTWYSQHPPFVGNDDKPHATYNNHAQYYPDVSNPG